MANTETEAENPEIVGLFEADAPEMKAQDQEAGVYEIGYHLLGTLSADEAAAATKDLTNFLTKQGAAFVGDKAAEKMDLAYTIQKRIGGKLTNFNDSYFGWMAFELQPVKLATVKSFLDTNASMLRYLVIATTKEEVTAVLEGAVIIPTAPTPTGTIGPSKRVAEEGAAVSEEALSQALETMAKEDEAVVKEA